MQLFLQEVEVSLSEWELGVVSGLKDMKEKLSLCEVREAHMTLLVTLLVTGSVGVSSDVLPIRNHYLKVLTVNDFRVFGRGRLLLEICAKYLCMREVHL